MLNIWYHRLLASLLSRTSPFSINLYPSPQIPFTLLPGIQPSVSHHRRHILPPPRQQPLNPFFLPPTLHSWPLWSPGFPRRSFQKGHYPSSPTKTIFNSIEIVELVQRIIQRIRITQRRGGSNHARDRSCDRIARDACGSRNQGFGRNGMRRDGEGVGL